MEPTVDGVCRLSRRDLRPRETPFSMLHYTKFFFPPGTAGGPTSLADVFSVQGSSASTAETDPGQSVLNPRPLSALTSSGVEVILSSSDEDTDVDSYTEAKKQTRILLKVGDKGKGGGKAKDAEAKKAEAEKAEAKKAKKKRSASVDADKGFAEAHQVPFSEPRDPASPKPVAKSMVVDLETSEEAEVPLVKRPRLSGFTKIPVITPSASKCCILSMKHIYPANLYYFCRSAGGAGGEGSRGGGG